MVLDQLALAYHFAAAPFDDADYPDPQPREYAALRLSVAEQFPNFGYYNEAAVVLSDVAESGVLVGDAIDDLADIARDLADVAARWEQTSQEDALWHFRFTFESHWGHHLRSLQLYLHLQWLGE